MIGVNFHLAISLKSWRKTGEKQKTSQNYICEALISMGLHKYWRKNWRLFQVNNTYRITQDYQYENGLLLETVELFKLEDGKEIPFAKIEEKAHIFRPVELEYAPTKFIN
jgi:hypothetical protein